MKQRQITSDDFHSLLSWLDEDRERAAEKYEAIRRRLITIFISRGCVDAEHLADETINRVIYRLPSLGDGYVGDPALYFYGVARMVLLEYLRAPRPTDEITPGRVRTVTPLASPWEEDERVFEALDCCLGKLAPKDRELITEYYVHGRDRLTRRRKLADALKLSHFSLRQRVRRLRARLAQCIKEEMSRRGD